MMKIKKIVSAAVIFFVFINLFYYMQFRFINKDQIKLIIADAITDNKIILPDNVNKIDILNSDFVINKKLENKNVASRLIAQYLVYTKELEHSWFIVTIRAWGENNVLYLGQTLNEKIECSIVSIGEDCEDALIINIHTPGTGKTGPYHESSIYNWDRTNFKTIYRSTFFQDSVNKIDTGFRIEIKENDSISVENVFTHKKELIYLESFIPHDFLNQICFQYKVRQPLVYDSTKNNFLSFQPIDIDDDSVFEIIAYENFTISTIDQDYFWCIGTCFVVLKYDVFTRQLVVIDSGFWCPSNNSETFEEYANNWYKAGSKI